MRKPSPSDLTDLPWQSIAPLIPVNTVGRPREVAMREVLNTIFSLNRSGCQWDLLPHDRPPKSTVSDDFRPWRADGTGQKIRAALRQKVQVAAGKEPAPRVGRIDRPTVKATESVECRGSDGGPKITGRKRPLIVDPLGLLLVVVVTVASADDGTIAPAVLGRLTADHRSRLELWWGDGKYPNPHLDGWLVETQAGDRIEVVSRPAGSVGLVKLPRRGVVERTFAWLGRSRRKSRD